MVTTALMGAISGFAGLPVNAGVKVQLAGVKMPLR